MIRQERAGQTSVSLLWQEPEQPNGIILEYEIKYYEKVCKGSRRWVGGEPTGHGQRGGPQSPHGLADLAFFGQDKEMQSYSTLKAVTTRATVSGLKPGTRYVFQVRARTSAGCGRFSQAMEVETGKPRECKEGEGLGSPTGGARRRVSRGKPVAIPGWAHRTPALSFPPSGATADSPVTCRP